MCVCERLSKKEKEKKNIVVGAQGCIGLADLNLVCACERERETVRETEGEGERERD